MHRPRCDSRRSYQLHTCPPQRLRLALSSISARLGAPVTGKESPMRRGAKPAKAKVEAKPPAHKSRKSEGSKLLDLEKRLAEALERD